MQGHHVTGGNHANHRSGAATLEHLEGLLGGHLQADGLKGVMNAAGGHGHDRSHRVVILGIDHVGGAELAGQLQL